MKHHESLWISTTIIMVMMIMVFMIRMITLAININNEVQQKQQQQTQHSPQNYSQDFHWACSNLSVFKWTSFQGYKWPVLDTQKNDVPLMERNIKAYQSTTIPKLI